MVLGELMIRNRVLSISLACVVALGCPMRAMAQKSESLAKFIDDQPLTAFHASPAIKKIIIQRDVVADQPTLVNVMPAQSPNTIYMPNTTTTTPTFTAGEGAIALLLVFAIASSMEKGAAKDLAKKIESVTTKTNFDPSLEFLSALKQELQTLNYGISITSEALEPQPDAPALLVKFNHYGWAMTEMGLSPSFQATVMVVDHDGRTLLKDVIAMDPGRPGALLPPPNSSSKELIGDELILPTNPKYLFKDIDDIANGDPERAARSLRFTLRMAAAGVAGLLRQGTMPTTPAVVADAVAGDASCTARAAIASAVDLATVRKTNTRSRIDRVGATSPCLAVAGGASQRYVVYRLPTEKMETVMAGSVLDPLGTLASTVSTLSADGAVIRSFPREMNLPRGRTLGVTFTPRADEAFVMVAVDTPAVGAQYRRTTVDPATAEFPAHVTTEGAASYRTGASYALGAEGPAYVKLFPAGN